MLTSIRTTFSKGIARWVLIVLVGLLIVSFGVWGIQDIFRGFRSTELARVGDTSIDVATFQRDYNNQLQALSRQLGQPLTPDQARAFGIEQQVLGGLVTDATLDERARDLGLGLSVETVATMVMEDPTFQAGTGRFDRDYFNAVLRQNGLDEASFFARQRLAYKRSQIGDAIGGAAYVPLVLREALARYGAETRSIDYFILAESALPSIPEPDAAALSAFFEENKTRFRAPEYRKFSYIALSPATIAAGMSVTDDDAKADYDSRKDRYTAPERREVQQIAFPNETEANAAAARLSSGAVTFDALVTERGLQPADIALGTVTRAQMLDPVIAEAAFGLAANTPSGVVKGNLTTVILRVTKIEPETVTPFEAVKDTIKREIAESRASREILDIQGRIEDERAGGATLGEIAPKFGLSVVEVAAADERGLDPDGKALDLPAAQLLLRSVFATEPGTDTDAIDARDAGFVWYDVEGVTPARDRTLDEARAAVTAAFVADARAKALRARAEEVVTELQGGKTLEDVAKVAGAEVKQAWDLKRNQPTQGLSADAVSALFATPMNGFGTATGGAPGERIVFKVVAGSVPTYDPAAEASKRVAEQIEAQISQDILTQYVQRSQDELGLTVNEQLLNQAIGATN